MINEKFYEELSKKPAIDCVPSLLTDNVLDFLLKYKLDKRAHDLVRQYALSLFCYGMDIHPSEVTKHMLRKYQVYGIYQTHILFERLRRFELLEYELPTAENMYKVSLEDIKYVRTALGLNIFPKEDPPNEEQI